MTDISGGDGWWQASDHKWYPPEQHPDHRAPASETPPTAPSPEPPPVVPPPPVAAPPAHVPPAPGPANNSKWIVVGVLAVAVLALAAFLLFGRDDGKSNTVAVSSTSTSSSSSASSSSSSSQLSDAQLQARMLTAQEIAPSFKAGTFTADSTTPTPCGQENSNITVPPTTDLGSVASDAATKAFFREELLIYEDAARAARAFDLGKQGLACTQGTTSTGARFTFSPPRDVSSDFGVPNSVAIDYEIGATSGELIAVQAGDRIVSFQFELPSSGADTTGLPDAITIAKRGLAKLDR
ncbi:MAG: hypothetical protein QOD38_1351 [Acidimicrobiaceae bacterium]